MITLGILDEYLFKTVEEYKEKVKKDKYFLETFGDYRQLDKIVYSIRDFLIGEFNKDLEEVKKDFEILGKYHAKSGIPFETILHSLLFIKDSLYTKLLESEKYLLLAPDLSQFFDEAINSHAKGYLSRIINTHLKDIKYIQKKYKVLYINTHLNWLQKFLLYVKGKEKNYPAIEPENCKFTDFLNSFDFKVKIEDEDIYRKIKNIHKTLHMYAKSLIFYLKDKEYVEAYFAYNNTINTSFKMLDFLNNVYFHFIRERKNIFLDKVIKKNLKENTFLIIINVLNLGTINRFYGEDIGDKVISVIEEKLSSILDFSSSSFIKGYSGEFYILLKEKPEKLYSFSEFLKKELEKITVRGEHIDLKFGVSVSLLELRNIKDKKDLLRLIDFTVEQSKNTLSKISIFKEEEVKKILDKNINKISFLVETIEKVFSSGSIELNFQPIFDLKTEQIISYEVLSRIKNDERTIVAEDFINLIYNMKLIKKFDFEVLKRLHELSDELRKLGGDLRLFVNISPVSLSSSDFVKSLISTIEELKKKCITIVVELTEQSILENYELLKFLKDEYNFIFAIDDFGTGYSSIRVVQDLSILGIIDYLKIDGTLIRDIHRSKERKKLIELIVNFAKFHKLKTIGEFIENKETVELLRHLGVDYGQGFYFKKPTSIKELLKALNEEFTRTV